MHIAGLGLHVIIAVLFAIHAMRTRQEMYWLFILFMFPLLGSIVYFVAVYLPNSRLERRAFRAVSAAANAFDPQRQVREARMAFDDAPTAQNRMRLAAILLDAGQTQAAAEHYEACLKGPFATDAEIRLGAATAFIESDRFAEALKYLDLLRQDRSDFRPETVSILRGRALAGLGRVDEARAEFESAVSRFGTFESTAEYTIFALSIGDEVTSSGLLKDLDRISAKWNAHSRELNAPVIRRLTAAQKLAARH